MSQNRSRSSTSPTFTARRSAGASSSTPAPSTRRNVVIVGGDITGKAMVPIIRRRDQWGHHYVRPACRAENRGRGRRHRTEDPQPRYYPVRMSGDDYDQLQADPEEVTRRFTQVILQETERWIEMADDKLRGKVHRVIVCPANDDMFELDPLLHQQGHVVEINDQDPLDLDGFQMISLGWTNPRRGTRSASYPRMSWPSGWTNWSPRSSTPHARSSTSTPRRTAADSTKRRPWTKTST